MSKMRGSFCHDSCYCSIEPIRLFGSESFDDGSFEVVICQGSGLGLLLLQVVSEVGVELWRDELDEDLAFAPLLFKSSKLHFTFHQAEPEQDITLVEWKPDISCI